MTAAATAPLPLRLVRWFWVPASAEGAGLDAAARARARAARALLLLGEHSLARRDLGDGPADPAASSAAAIANFRAALALGVADARGVEGVDALLADGAASLEGDPAERARLRRVLVDAPLGELSAANEGALLDDATRAREFTRRALDPLLTREASRAERLRARFTRIALLLLTLVVVAAVGPGVRRALRTDLGPTARWRASTTMGPLPREGVGFRPREGEGNFFFQTQIEPEPHIEFDLGGERPIESITVQNRLDCCQDWAVPMVIEVAGANRRWREVGRRVEPFYFYTAGFPRAPARYVRLRVPRMTSLHLGAVKIR